jgi:hypothetical protein
MKKKQNFAEEWPQADVYARLQVYILLWCSEKALGWASSAMNVLNEKLGEYVILNKLGVPVLLD